MSPKLTKPRPPQPAFFEDVDEARGTTLPGTKVSASANTKVKRSSKESLEDDRALIVADRGGGSIAGDSGYSSQGPTVSSKSTDYTNDHSLERKSRKSDSTRRKPEEKKRPETRTERQPQRASSQAPAERSRSKARKDPESSYDHHCRECRPREKSHSERSSRRYSREIVDVPVKELRAATPSQPQPRARPERTHTDPQPRPRPISADYTRMASNIYQAPPSAWTYQGQTRYTMAPPPVLAHVTPVPYSPIAVAEVPRSVQPPMIRRQSVSSGRPILQQAPMAATVAPVQYSATPIMDNRHRYSMSGFDAAAYRREQERAVQHQARRAAEAAQSMPPPARRPSRSRSGSSSTKVHQALNHESSSRREMEMPSPTKRPPSRTSASYHSSGSRRDSSVYPMVRRNTVDGHVPSHELDRKVHAAEKYLRTMDTNPRLHLTPDSVKQPKPARVPSNAGSHRSRSSRGSGHKTTSSQSNGGITLTTDAFKISISDPKNKEFSFKSSEKGVLLTVGDDGKKKRTMLISKDADGGRSGEGKSDRRSLVSRHSSSSKKSERSKK